MEIEPTEYYEIVDDSVEQVSVILNDPLAPQLQRRVVENNLAFWAVIDGVLLVFIIGGNLLTILAVRFSRRLRSVISNMFVLSLAISDMVVGFTLPYHLAFYMRSGLGNSHIWCLLRFFLVILACCVSIWNLIAIAVDRYIAIVYPLHYSRYMTKKVALILLGFGWIVGVTFALIPMFWNNWSTATQCEFDEILPPWYMAGVITPGFAMVWVCMLIVYWRIWREASKHAKQIRSSFTGLHETPSDWKSVQVVLFILGCFSICWLPYFIIACAQIFKFLEKSSPTLYKGAFSLAMANSGMNPIIYAWKNSSFRRAFARLLRCKSPDHIDVSQHSTRSNMHRKSSSLHPQDTVNATITCTPPASTINGSFIQFEDRIGRNDEYHSDINKANSRRVSLALTHLNPIESTKLEIPSVVVFSRDTEVKRSMIETKITTEPISLDYNSGDVATNAIKGKNVVVQQIECDGNGNTHIRIMNNEKKPTQHLQQIRNAVKIGLSQSGKITESGKESQCINQVLNGRFPIVEQLANGNHIMKNMKNINNQVV